MQRLEFRAMGCQMLALVDSDSPEARDDLARVPAWFEEWERQLSRFREDSDLCQLNREPDRPVRVRAALWEVVRAALLAARWSGGLVTPTVLPALEAAGYDRSFELVPAASPDRQLPSPVPDWRSIRCDPEGRTIRLPVGVRLDLGGIAKGWAADRAARRLAKRGPALVDAGGDIAVSGLRAGGERWPVAVDDPAQPGQQLALLMLARGAVATSGRDYRRWRHGGVWAHHILDPRTGEPARTDVLSATVVAPTAVEAEVAAKAALILGSRAGLAWLDERPPLAGLLVLESGEVIRTRRLSEHIWAEGGCGQ